MIEHIEDVDIIVVGGGPSGTSTALHLERINPTLLERTLLLERHHHPRNKICGGALTLNAESILRDLDVSLDVGSAPVHHVRLVYGDASIDLPEDGCAKRIIRRCDFDSMLFRKACERGLRVVEGIRVTKVVRHPGHLQVITDRGYYRAKVVVSADGVHAVLRRTPGFKPGRMTRLYEVETPAEPTAEPVFIEQTLLVDLSYIREGLGGYYWDFPCHIDGKPYVSRGIVADSRRGSQAYLEEILTRRGVSLEGAIRVAWPIRHFDPSERLSQPRMLLVGDAMGSDPLFSEGISQGLAGGRLAAEALDDAFRRNDLSFWNYTKSIHRSRLGKELAVYARAARFLYGRHSELVLSMLHRNPELARMIGHSYAGTVNLGDSLPRIARMVASHLWSCKRNLRGFRAQAAVEAALARTSEPSCAEPAGV
jgi:flavin-dependent dehydrogenase